MTFQARAATSSRIHRPQSYGALFASASFGPRERGLPCRVGTSRKECPSKACIDVLQLLARALLHVAIEGVAVGVDTDGERAEVLDPELPEALGHELLPGDLLDLLDLRRLERGGAPDDREVDHPEPPHRVDRLV